MHSDLQVRVLRPAAPRAESPRPAPRLVESSIRVAQSRTNDLVRETLTDRSRIATTMPVPRRGDFSGSGPLRVQQADSKLGSGGARAPWTRFLRALPFAGR